MDPVTHAASGALLMLALPKRPATAWAIPLACLAAAAPDIDTFFCRSPELFLALHRGITHSLPALPLFSLILALAFRPLWRRGADDAFSFVGTWIFCAACVLLHIWLDCITTFGTMILQPFSDLRVRLNGVFIVDLILTVPLLVLTVCALRRKNARRRLAAAGLIWIFLYPAGAIAANLAHTATLRTELASGGISVREITIFPDVFSPFFWRAVSLQEKDGHFTVHEQSLDYRARPRAPEKVYPALAPSDASRLASQSGLCRQFLNFLIMPVAVPLPPDNLKGSVLEGRENTEGFTSLLVYDLRFGSGLAFARAIMAKRPNANIPFRLMLILDRNGSLIQERLVFSDSRTDTGWLSAGPQKN